MQVRGGQEVRFIDLPSDTGKGLGAFDTVQDYANGHEFAMAIKDNALEYYGTAAEAFLEMVTTNYDKVQLELKRYVNQFLSFLALEETDPQVKRVAQRFAQVAASGELASELGITGWDEGEANNAALACFNAWIDARGGHGSQEDKIAVEQVNDKLLASESSRFSSEGRTAIRTSPPWGTMDSDFYYILPGIFKNELCAGLDHRAVETVLKSKGLLVPSKNRATIQKKYNGQPKWIYKISKKIHELNSVETEVENTSELLPEDVKIAA